MLLCKSDTDIQRSYTIAYMWNLKLKKGLKLIHKPEVESQIVDNKLMVSRGCGGER